MSRIVPPNPVLEVVYPDTDGRPMAENTRQYRWIVMIKENLEVLFGDRPDVFIAGDLFWYPVEGNPRIVTAPDVMVAIGRPKGDRDSFKQWEEAGVAPQVVFEIRSTSNSDAEMAEKLRFYERHGVEEFYDFDPETGSLFGWQRTGRVLKAIPDAYGSTSPTLGIRFERDDGPEFLRIVGPDGGRFLTTLEHSEARKLAERRAQAERERAERLAAKLRELGIEPD
ncbi:Uma2 family endonuclease [Aquisphaera insulae]|uniref:Uma2 family endonuclease n=1 Tax=Aquisphaera insulae TaxID=2712864 RepID=UPI0013EBBC55|nr:Uma2 family endonuclease [Aquisphaera insulae]